MKTSNKILWGSFAALLATSVIFLVLLKSVMIQPVDAASDFAGSADKGSRDFALSGFAAVSLEGHWEAMLSQGDPINIHVEGPEDLLASLSVRRQGDVLVLRMAKQRRDKSKLTLAVTMPAINRLTAEGVVDLTLQGFDTDRLSIGTKGVTTVRGSEGRVGTLDLEGEGVSRVELEKIPVGSAALNFKGVFNIDLTMDGGELTGNLKGVGEVRYQGETSRQSIRHEGPCKITRKSDADRV